MNSGPMTGVHDVHISFHDTIGLGNVDFFGFR